jgi:predicted anti-sigma-YlaC factor YlaD
MNQFLYRLMSRLGFRMMGEPQCGEVNRFLAEYLEGELDAETSTRYESHLSECPPCGTYFQQYQETIGLARSCQDVALPDDLVEHTLAFLRDKRAD